MTVDGHTSPYWREFDAAVRALLGVAVLAASALAAALTLAGLPAANAQRGMPLRCASCMPGPSGTEPSQPPHSPIKPSSR